MKIKGTPPQAGYLTHSWERVSWRYLSHGRIVVAKWPRRRPGPLPQVTQDQVAAWDQTQEFVKWPEPSEYAAALRASSGTAFYARDQLIMAMYGNLISWPGWGWRVTMADNIQALLDTITTTPGSLLFRGPVEWEGLVGGSAGYVLTMLSDGGDPGWEAPAQSVRIVTVRVSSAEILALHSLPVEVVPSPGAGLVIVPLRTLYAYAFGTHAYSAPGTVALFTAPAASGFQSDEGTGTLLGLSASRVAFSGTSQSPVSNVPSMFDGAALQLWAASSDPTGGDGTLTVTVGYLLSPIS